MSLFKHIDALDFEEPDPPKGGWTKPCQISDHKWELEIEGGRVLLHATDPCTEEDAGRMDTNLGGAVCRYRYWETDDIHMENRVPVKVTHVDDSTISTPNGPAEYGFYIEVELSL